MVLQPTQTAFAAKQAGDVLNVGTNQLSLVLNLKTLEIESKKWKRMAETSSKLTLSSNVITVAFDKQTGAISYADKAGKPFLNKIAGSRKLEPGIVMLYIGPAPGTKQWKNFASGTCRWM